MKKLKFKIYVEELEQVTAKVPVMQAACRTLL
jgi:hypothetical protein